MATRERNNVETGNSVLGEDGVVEGSCRSLLFSRSIWIVHRIPMKELKKVSINNENQKL